MSQITPICELAHSTIHILLHLLNEKWGREISRRLPARRVESKFDFNTTLILILSIGQSRGAECDVIQYHYGAFKLDAQ